MSLIKSSEEIELIRESALLVSKTLGMLAKEIKPGISTLKLDSLAENFIRDNDAEPGFLGLYDFPNTLCVSPNDQVVHGIPNEKEIENGDILSIDCGVLKNQKTIDNKIKMIRKFSIFVTLGFLFSLNLTMIRIIIIKIKLVIGIFNNLFISWSINQYLVQNLTSDLR